MRKSKVKGQRSMSAQKCGMASCYLLVAKTSNFRPICGYILERVLDRGIPVVTMEDEYKVVCALSNSATFDDLE